MKKEKKIKWSYVFLGFGTLITPTYLIWNLCDFIEPQGIFETLKLFIAVIITGLGGLGIGIILLDKLADIIKELEEE